MLDIRRKAKNANRKSALNSGGSGRMSHALDMAARVVRSKIPLGVEEKFELIEMLLI